MNIILEIFTKLISFLSRVHLGRVMKRRVTSNHRVTWRAADLTFQRNETSEGKETNEKGSYDSARH